MLTNHTSLPFSLLLTIFIFSSTSFNISHGGSQHQNFLPLQTQPISGWRNEGNFVVGFSSTAKRSLVEGPISSSVEPIIENSSLVLAAKRTYRKDPLDGFKRYERGWNISERHYWASVGFTAAPLFAIAAIWFICFGLCLSFICLCYFCCGRKSYGYSRTAYAFSLIFLILFTVISIIGCVVLYTGQEKFHASTTTTLKYVVYQADTTVNKLRTVSDYLFQAKLIAVDQVFIPSNVQTDIDQIETKINSSASSLADRTMENSNEIQDLLDSVRFALIIIAAIMLLLTFLGFLFSIFGMQFLVYILVIFGWILVTGTFILCGIFVLLHNVTADTCVAMEQWVEYPAAHTSLDDILPCVDNATTQETLSKSKEVTFQLVDVINQVITNVSNVNFSPNFVPLYFNQSGPVMPILCNPFHPDLTNRSCDAGEVDLNNATLVWNSYVCEVSSTGICATTGRITPTFYNQMAAAVNVSYGLYNYGPVLADLQDCTFVRETFEAVYRYHCPGLQLYSKWICIGLIMVSSAVMFSLIFWVIYGRERRHRVSNKQSFAGFYEEK